MLYHILLTNVLQFSGVFFKYAKYSSHIYKKIFQYYVGGYFTSFNHPSGEWKVRRIYTKFSLTESVLKCLKLNANLSVCYVKKKQKTKKKGERKKGK